MNIKTLHKAYKELKALEDRQDEALKQFCEAFSPETYPLFHTEGPMKGFMGCLQALNADLAEEYMYYAYEVPGMKEAMVEKDGKKWNFSKEEEFLDYLITYYEGK